MNKEQRRDVALRAMLRDRLGQVRQACGSDAELARIAECTRQNVGRWDARIPIERCEPIERNSGGRWTREWMRPDVFRAPAAAPVPDQTVQRTGSE